MGDESSGRDFLLTVGFLDATTYPLEGEEGVNRWEDVHTKHFQGPEFMKRRQLFKNAKKPSDSDQNH